MTGGMRADVRLLEARLREKDHELKLADMKIKELKKQIPHLKLKPLPRGGRASSLNAARNGQKRVLRGRKRTIDGSYVPLDESSIQTGSTGRHTDQKSYPIPAHVHGSA